MAKMLCLYLLLSIGGMAIGSLWGLRTSGIFLAGFGCFLLAIGSAFMGVLLTLGAFKGEIQNIEDGKNDILLTIKLGPFSYTRTIPTIKKP